MSPPGRVEDLGAVLVRVGRGDQEAFAQFYDATAGMVFGLVLRVLRDRAQAEEVTQEVFVQAWRTAAGYRAGRGSVRAWLNTIAHRRAVDRVRSVSRAVAREGRYESTRHATDAPGDVAEVVIAGEEQVLVRRALAGLPEVQAEALRLVYFDGLTQRAAAEVLGVPLGTVKTRIRGGMARLRDRLGEDAR